tara:strand:+ start:736 stop:1041 length:306 start_codon:yes stop_codon:yes gene_type:complete
MIKNTIKYKAVRGSNPHLNSPLKDVEYKVYEAKGKHAKASFLNWFSDTYFSGEHEFGKDLDADPGFIEFDIGRCHYRLKNKKPALVGFFKNAKRMPINYFA